MTIALFGAAAALAATAAAVTGVDRVHEVRVHLEVRRWARGDNRVRLAAQRALAIVLHRLAARLISASGAARADFSVRVHRRVAVRVARDVAASTTAATATRPAAQAALRRAVVEAAPAVQRLGSGVAHA